MPRRAAAPVAERTAPDTTPRQSSDPSVFDFPGSEHDTIRGAPASCAVSVRPTSAPAARGRKVSGTKLLKKALLAAVDNTLELSVLHSNVVAAFREQGKSESKARKKAQAVLEEVPPGLEHYKKNNGTG